MPFKGLIRPLREGQEDQGTQGRARMRPGGPGKARRPGGRPGRTRRNAKKALRGPREEPEGRPGGPGDLNTDGQKVPPSSFLGLEGTHKALTRLLRAL